VKKRLCSVLVKALVRLEINLLSADGFNAHSGLVANPKRASAVLRTQDHNHSEFMGARVFIARYGKLEVAQIKSL
jgi:hypothetical protein